ncbi:MAG: LPS export ABC transporter periplasmic protein LptC, partial [Bdellovibrionales bacterium]|nr:LPS export ABC transporter periplasmic protein LptC [Bdellovibrionales bacterium]
MPKSLLLRAKPAILGLVTQGQNQNRKVILWVGTSVWAAALWFWPAAVESERGLTPREPNSKEQLFRSTLTDAQLGILGFHLYETREGKRYWNIESQFAELYRESNQTLMRKVTAEFFSQNSDNVVTTRGDRGRSEIEKNLVELEGNVFVSSRRGYVFNLDEVTYRGNTHELQSDSPVSMKGPDPELPTMYIKGDGLQAFINEEFYKVRKNVRGRKRLSDQRWLHIASTSGEFFPDYERARFYGKVRSSIQDLEIDSERLEVATSEG